MPRVKICKSLNILKCVFSVEIFLCAKVSLLAFVFVVQNRYQGGEK